MPESSFFPTDELQAFRRSLLAWYKKHARDLPWRKSGDPYRVWVSEVMLQQTQVETVKSYFERFMESFPTVEALASAQEEAVLRLWEGLGYYRRARSLHAAAKMVVDDFEGKMPGDVATLMKLPGVGRYTAGAIVSIAYDKPAPILEANTIRLFTRLTAYDGNPTNAAGQRFLWGVAEELLPKKQVSRFNQALMELGSLICTPTSPQCTICPTNKLCRAFQTDQVELLQPTTKKLKFSDLNEVAVVVRNRSGAVLIRRCADGERWAGLWDFPRFERKNESPITIEAEIAEQVSKLTGIACDPGAHLKTIKHAVTRFRITLDCYEANRTEGRLRGNREAMRWVMPNELSELPLSVTGRKIAELIS